MPRSLNSVLWSLNRTSVHSLWDARLLELPGRRHSESVMNGQALAQDRMTCRSGTTNEGSSRYHWTFVEEEEGNNKFITWIILLDNHLLSSSITLILINTWWKSADRPRDSPLLTGNSRQRKSAKCTDTAISIEPRTKKHLEDVHLHEFHFAIFLYVDCDSPSMIFPFYLILTRFFYVDLN